MAECKKCLHFDICKMYADDVRGDYEDSCLFEDCSNFKNKEDFVEVVRCKDCIHYEASGFVYEEGYGRCDHPRQEWEVECYSQWVETRPNDFCSYGTPKERGGEK